MLPPCTWWDSERCRHFEAALHVRTRGSTFQSQIALTGKPGRAAFTEMVVNSELESSRHHLTLAKRQFA